MSRKETIEYDGITLLVYYTVIPEEKRNYGHPDDRLPDVESEIIIDEIELHSYDEEEIQDLLKTKLQNKTS